MHMTSIAMFLHEPEEVALNLGQGLGVGPSVARVRPRGQAPIARAKCKRVEAIIPSLPRG